MKTLVTLLVAACREAADLLRSRPAPALSNGNGRVCLGFATLAATLLLASQAFSQVQSITLGIRTHCPYGIRGCWPEIRDGLETPTAITAITGEPDILTDTCQVKMREDWAADPELFQRNFREMRIGVDVRGVEAVVEGYLETSGQNLFLRVSKTDNVLPLARLQTKVQWDKERKQPQAATITEQGAFEALKESSSRHSGRLRITGPLRSNPDKKVPTLEVRQFEFLDSKS